MADTNGLNVGSTRLGELLNHCVECFDHIQVGKAFGKDYQSCQLELDIAKLRLCRWAESVRISQDAINPARAPDRDLQRAEKIFTAMMNEFADMQTLSEHLKFPDEQADGAVVSSTAQGPSTMIEFESARNTLKSLAWKRQRHSSLTKKSVSTLHEQRHFLRFMEEVKTLIDDLEALFPDTETARRQLYLEDIKTLRAEGHIDRVADVAKTVDDGLWAFSSQSRMGPPNVVYRANVAKNKVRAEYGDYISPNSVYNAAAVVSLYEGNIAEGEAKAHYGRNFGGKFLFTD